MQQSGKFTLVFYRKLWLVQFIIALVALIFIQISHPLKFNTDLSQLFSLDNQNSQADLVLERFAKQNESQNIILLANPSLEDAIADSKTLKQQLSSLEQIELVQNQFNFMPKLSEIIQFYQVYRHSLLSDSFRQLLIEPNPQGLFQTQFGLLNQVANPFVSETLAIDPSLSLADYLTYLPQPNQNLKQKDSFVYIEHGHVFYVLTRFQTAKSGLALAQSHQLVEQLKLIDNNLASDMIATGQVFYADYAGQSAEREMFLFSSISILGIIFLIVLAYRNLAALFLTLAIIGVSLLYGYLALSLFFDEVHILTFVFAVTLVGIAADYSFHALTELAKQSKTVNSSCVASQLSNIKLPLLMGFVSTAIGYFILMFAPFDIFTQVGVFILAGLAGALYAVMVLFPWLVGHLNLSTSTLEHPLVMQLNRFQQAYCQFKYLGIFLGLATIAVCYLCYQPAFKDDVRDFYRVSPEISQNEIIIRDILGYQDEFQFLLVSGETEDSVLTTERGVLNQLNQLKQQGVLHNYSALSQWVPSLSEQEANRQLIEQAFTQGKMDAFAQVLAIETWLLNPSEQKLTLAAWLNSPLGKAFESQWFDYSEQVFSVIKLQGITDLALLTTEFEGVENVNLIDKASLISTQLSFFRVKLAWLLALSLLVAGAILAWVYGIKKSVLVILIPSASVVIALLVSLLIQTHLNIFNALASVLIIALGLDYAVFYADNGLVSKISFATLISALSSILVFAVLALSVTPAIFSFGLTVFIGIVVTYLLAPFAAVFQNKDLT